MTFPTNKLDFAVCLHKKLQSQPLEGDRNYRAGTLPDDIAFDEVIDWLEEHQMRGLRDDQQTRYIEFSPPPRFYGSIADLLKAPERRVSVPHSFYVVDHDFYYKEGTTEAPSKIVRYIEIAQLFQALAKVADDQRSLAGEKVLVFLGAKKLEVTSDYGEEDLVDLKGLSSFNDSFINTETHVDQKKTILRTVLFSLFEGRAQASLKDVASKFEDFAHQAEASYQLYVSEFSFQKVKAEVEREKLEFMTRLNKVFSDIQNQLLAIPVALVLVGGQMKPGNGLTFANVLIWLGAVVFATLMWLLIRNQKNTLKAVKTEIDHQWRLIKGEHSQVAAQFEESYYELDTRYKHQQRLLFVVFALVISSMLLATFLLVWHSGYRFNAVLSWLSSLSECFDFNPR